MNKMCVLSLFFSVVYALLMGCASQAPQEAQSSGYLGNSLEKRYNPSIAQSYRHRIRHRRDLKPLPVKPKPKPKPQPKPKPKPKPKPVVINDCPHLVNVEASAPRETSVGQVYIVEADLIPCESVGDVFVDAHVPDGVSLVKSEPRAELQGNRLRWYIDYLEKDKVRTVKAWLRAERTGDLQVCFVVSVKPIFCVATNIVKPALSITKSGPARAKLGQEVTYDIVVSNTGSGMARNLVVTDQVPEGLVHASGQRNLRFELPQLAAGASKKYSVTFKATRRGKLCNVAVVESSNAGKTSAQACTEVLKEDLDLVVSCPPSSFVGKKSSQQIVISNPGDTVLNNVLVTATHSPDLKILSAPGAEIAPQKLTWQVNGLQPKQKKVLEVDTITKVAGKHCLEVTAKAGGISQTKSCCTNWKGFPALLIELIDTNDPLLVGEETTYIIEVTNQGTAPDKNIKLVAKFPAQISPISASGDSRGEVKGKTVEFAPYPQLAPKQKIKYTIQAKGVQEGDSRLKVEMTSQLLKKPVTEEESTQVY